MPDQLRMKVTGDSSLFGSSCLHDLLFRLQPGSSLKSQTVYDEFARCLPGFLPSPSEVYVPGTGSNSLNLASQQPGVSYQFTDFVACCYAWLPLCSSLEVMN